MTLEFDITPHEEEVILSGTKYLLKEASEDTVRRYKNAMFAGVKMGSAGKPETITNLADLDSLLVGDCLYRVKEDDTCFPTPVGQNEVRRWPRRVVKSIAAHLKEISEIDSEDEEETAKNVLKDTATG